MIGASEISKIFLDIAQRHCGTNQWDRINTFAVIDSYDDFIAPNFNRSSKDNDLGLYWTRSPYTENNDCREPIYLFIQFRYSRRQDPMSPLKCIGFNIGAAMPEICESCPEHYSESKQFIDSLLEDTVYAVIDQFFTYRKFKIESDGVVQFVFATQEQIDCEDDIVELSDCGPIYPEVKELRVKYDKCIGANNIRLSYTNIEICGCHVSEQKFDVKSTFEPAKKAVIKCDHCY